MAGRNSDEIRCSFCNKTQDQVRKMIAGPSGVYICDPVSYTHLRAMKNIEKTQKEIKPN